MAKFKPAVDLILKHEGGYVDNPNDRGGETVFGISKRAFPSLEIRDLSVNGATEIYLVKYWNKIKGDGIKNQALANAFFDYAVNSGPETASLEIQRCCNMLRPEEPIKADGIIGPLSLNAINACNADTLRFRLCRARIDRLLTICEKSPSQRVFLRGWMSRAVSFI
jgi:lysozyme family protein